MVILLHDYSKCSWNLNQYVLSFKEVEKVSGEREENSPVSPQHTEVTQENSHIEKQQLPEEELALLQEITNTVVSILSAFTLSYFTR